MGLAGLSVIFSTELPILLARKADARAEFLGLVKDRYLFIPHALGGTVATIIGPLQFSSRLRRRHLRLHRQLGRCYALAILVASISAVLIEWSRPLFLATLVKASAWALCTLVAVLAARNGQIPQHRRWMIRSYALTFSFIAVRVLNVWPGYASMSEATFSVVDVTATLLAFVGPDLALDWPVIRGARRSPSTLAASS